MVQTHIDVPNKQVYFEKINELVNFFALTKGFGIVFCVADNFFFRKEVNRQLIERLADKDIIVIDFLLEEEENIAVVEQLKKLKLTNPTTKGILINNLDFLLENQSDALAAFNQSRDILSKLEIPLLFWLGEENIRSLSKSAPDIYTFRSLPILEFKDIPNFQSESFLQTRFSEEYRTTEDYEKIRLKIELLERQLEEAESQGYPKGKIIDQIVTPLFYDYIELRILNKTKDIFDKYKENLDNTNLKHLELKFVHYKNLREFDDALFIARDMIKIEKRENRNKSLALSYYNISRIYKEQKLYLKALEFLLKSKEILEKNNPNDSAISACYNELATISKRIGKYTKAEKYQLKALEHIEQIGIKNEFLKGGAYNNLALIYLRKGELKSAEQYQLKALKILKSYLDDYHPEIANCYHNYAGILSEKANHKKAFIYEELAFKILDKGQYHHLPLFSVVKSDLLLYKKKLPFVREQKVRRNTPCPCGSNKKYKNCCLNKKAKIPSTSINLQ